MEVAQPDHLEWTHLSQIGRDGLDVLPRRDISIYLCFTVQEKHLHLLKKKKSVGAMKDIRIKIL